MQESFVLDRTGLKLAITRSLLGVSVPGNHRLGELIFKVEDICLYTCILHNTQYAL